MWDVIISILTVAEVLVALLLIGIVLIQQSKSGGGLGAMGGAVTESFFGPASGNIMTKITVYLASFFLGLTLVLAIITGHRKPGRSVVEAYEPEEKPVAEEVVTPDVKVESSAAEAEATEADADAKTEEGAAAADAGPALKVKEDAASTTEKASEAGSDKADTETSKPE